MPTTSPITATSAAQLASTAFGNSPENYGSFAGTNITATVNHVQVGTLMGISYTIHTEKQAQYTFGSANVRRFTTGKRGIAGTLVFNTFDRAALISIFTGANNIGEPLLNLYAQGPPLINQAVVGNTFNSNLQQLGSFNPTNAQTFFDSGASTNFNTALGNDIADAYANAFAIPLDYADQLPPFDVTLTMVDNQGSGAYMVIGGIEIMNEGGGFTVDDLTNQTAYTYVARYVRPITPISATGT